MAFLTQEQRTAIDFPGDVLLTACPGSGKTRTIISKLIKEVENLRGTPRRVACITYTNSAVHEIEHRVRSFLPAEDQKSFSVSTIHSFCFANILRPFSWRLPAGERSTNILTRENPQFEEIVRFAASQIGAHEIRPTELDDFESLSIDANGEIAGSALRNDIVRLSAPFFWQRCDQLGYVDFCNIIYRSFKLLRSHPDIVRSIAARFAYFLIDEFQDTTDVQIEIFKLIQAAGLSKFFVVGDLSQSIYAFTGARPELVEGFGTHIEANTALSLTGNYRSNPQIVQHAEMLFPRNPPMVAVGPNRSCTIIPQYVHADSSFTAVVEHFLPFLEEQGIPLGKSAVLARNWSMLLPLSRHLREMGVPIVGPGARPYRRSRTFATLAEQLGGFVTEPHPDSWINLERALFHAIQEITGERNLEIFSYRGRICLTKLLHMARILYDTHVGSGVHWLEAMAQASASIISQSGFLSPNQSYHLVSSAQEMIADIFRNTGNLDTLSVEDLGLFASPNRALRLSTIHFSKGREYDAVAIIGLNEGTLPDFRSQTQEDYLAEKRLFYVAVTRAKRFVMYVSEYNRHGNRPSRYLRYDGVNVVD